MMLQITDKQQGDLGPGDLPLVPQNRLGDDLDFVGDARDAADFILGRYLRLDVAKAMNLGTPAGFDRAVILLARRLRARAADSDQAAVKAALAVLDVDWHQTTAEQRRSLIAQAMKAAGRKTSEIPGKVQAVLGKAATEVVRATRDGARRDRKLAIAADFNAIDQRVIRHLRSSQANYVRDEYGRRHEAFSEEARRIVADGIEAGLGRDEIAGDLAKAAEGIIAGRASFYWEVIAGAFIGRGRSFAQLSAYAEAAITSYRIVAVLDEVTTPTCRFLDGKVFSVSQGLDLFEQVEAAPDRIKELTPWVRDTVDPATGKHALSVERGGKRIAIADIVRSGVGTRDDRGEFSQGLGERELGGLGIGFPPFHALCRSSCIPFT
ncbi:MAG: head morphogenesis protein [Pseudomonadota bacterium]